MTESQNSTKRLIVAIGGVLGVLASILGVVAVFFPDELNLSKKHFASFSVQIDSPNAVESLDKFLDSQKGNIVELDVSVCVSREVQCPRIEAEESRLSAKFSREDAGYCNGDNNKLGEGVEFYFDDPDSKKVMWDWEKFEQCKGGDEDGVNRISGHFLVPTSAGFGQGWTEWLLTPLSAKDVQLRNY
ncbi:MAG: hypothetical protein ACRER2_16290 [Methylococcales bacterium]